MIKHVEILSRIVSIINTFFFNPNRFRYWLHKYIGFNFRPKAPDFPGMVIVETSSYCNLSCLHCPRTDIVKNDHSFEGLMDLSLFKKIIDEMSRYKRITLRPFGRGEALTNPQFPKMIKYAKEKGISKIWLNTNGVLLTPKISEELLEAGIDWLEVSIDAATEKTFATIKGTDAHHFETVVGNTINYSRLIKKLHPEGKLIISFVESSLNTSEKDDFINFWRNYTDHVNIRPVHQHGDLVKDLRASNKKIDEIERLPCPMLWNRVEINYLGDLKYCEFDWENKGVMGTVQESSIGEIWNSEKYKELRQMHTEKHFSEIPLCKDCKTCIEVAAW